jgi:hypothetical protein
MSINVFTDQGKYVTGQPIKILGTTFDLNNDNKTKFITIIVLSSSTNDSNPIFKTILNTTGKFSAGEENLKIETPGDYKVYAYVNNKTVEAFNSFHVYEPFTSLPAFFMYGTFASIGMLMVVILKDVKRSTYIAEMLRFSCLTAIVVLPIMGLFSTDLEMGSSSTMGIIKEPPQDENGKAKIENNIPIPGGEWKINVGGTRENSYDQGMQIPIYVIIFGLVGSYIRYLYKTAHLKKSHYALQRVKEDILKKYNNPQVSLENIQDKHIGLTDFNLKKFMIDTGEIDEKIAAIHLLIIRRRGKVAFHQSLEDLSLFILSPFMSIVVWFTLLQSGMDDPYVIATVSFLVGLFIEQIMLALRDFLGTILRGIGEKIDEEGVTEDKVKNKGKQRQFEISDEDE